MPIDPLVYRPASRGEMNLVESYFVKLNSPDGQRALWVRSTLLSAIGRAPRAEQWLIAFERGSSHVVIKRSYELDPARNFPPTGELCYPDATFDGSLAKGSLARDDHRVSWHVKLFPRFGPLKPFPHAWMYSSPIPEQKLTSPIPDAIADGWYEVDGRRIDVTGWRAMHGHNWGRRNTHRYVWVHASGFDEADDVIFEGFSGRLQRLGIEAPWLTLAFVFVGNEWIRFDDLAQAARARASAHVMHWSVETRRGPWRIRAEASAPKELVVGLHYWNPDAPVCYCLNTKLASMTLEIDGPGVRRRLTTQRAALEIGWPSADHGIAMRA